MMSHVGFTLHPDKSVFIPTQALTFLRFILNSIDMSVSPTPEKISKTISFCNRLIQTSGPSVQLVSEVIGILVSNLPGVQFSQLHYRSLEIDKILALKTMQGNYNATMQLSCQSTQDLAWCGGSRLCQRQKAYCPTKPIKNYSIRCIQTWMGGSMRLSKDRR